MVPAHLVLGAAAGTGGAVGKRLSVVGLVIGIQIAQGEAVMAGDVVDGVPRAAAAGFEQVVGTGEPGSHASGCDGNKAELVLRGAEDIAETIIPFGPADGEVALLLAGGLTGSGVRFGDKVHADSANGGPGRQFSHGA